MATMSKKKPKKPDQHRSPHMVRLSAEVYEAMKSQAQEEDRPMTRVIQQAMIEFLKRKGKWKDDSSSST